MVSYCMADRTVVAVKNSGTLDRGNIATRGEGTTGSASAASMRNSKSFEGGCSLPT